jgi:hypothetical protein
MAGKTPREAVQNFQTPLQQALSCVTNAVLLTPRTRHSDTLNILALSEGPAPLGRDRRYALRFLQHYRVIEYEGPRGPWKVNTVAYYYTLLEASSQQEILGYHWHPRGRSPVTYPHLHLHRGAGVGQHRIQEAHLPTGRIAIEDVLRLAIEHFSVQPLRPDWEAILSDTQDPFETWRTWP